MIAFRSLYTAAFIITGALGWGLRAQEEPSIIHVSADKKGDYKTIQEAVDNASAESIVRVGKGTWTEAVTVTRPLTLEGVGWDVSRLVSAQAEQAARPSSEVVEALERISRELDSETRAKLQQAFHKVYASSPVLVVRGAERVVIRNLSFLRSEPVREGGFAKGGCIEVVDSTVEMENCAILESPGIGLTAKGDRQGRQPRPGEEMPDRQFVGHRGEGHPFGERVFRNRRFRHPQQCLLRDFARWSQSVAQRPALSH